jgi:hypothetical protein
MDSGPARTCSPVSQCFASLTFPMLPAPIVLPSAHVPVLGAVMLVLRFVAAGCTWPAVTPLGGMAEAVDASEAYRAWLRLLDSVRVGVGAARSLDSLRRTWLFATLLCSQSWAATLFRPWGWRELLGRAAELCERWGRSEGLAWGGARRAEGFRTTDGDDGVAVDMVPVVLGAGCSGGPGVRTGALGVSSGRRCDQIAVGRGSAQRLRQWAWIAMCSVKVLVGVRRWEGAVTLAARRDEGALAVSQRPCIPRL